MKLHYSLTLGLGLFAASASNSQDSSPSSNGSATSIVDTHVAELTASPPSTEGVTQYAALDLRALLYPAFSHEEIRSVSFGGVTSNGKVWGTVTGAGFTDGFILGSGGSVHRIRSNTSAPEGGGDVGLPSVVSVVGVSMAGDYVYGRDGAWSVVRASGVETPLLVSGIENPVPLGVGADGSVVVRTSDGASTTFARMTTSGSVVSSVSFAGMPWDYIGVGTNGAIDGSMYSWETGSYVPFVATNATVHDPFGGAASQLIRSVEGGYLGIVQQSSYPWSAVTVEGTTAYLAPEGLLGVSGIVVRGDERINLYGETRFAIPFSLSRDARVVVGVGFEDARSYAETGMGALAVWKDGSFVRASAVGGVRSVHDGLGVTDSGIVFAKAIGNDGISTIAVATPSINDLPAAPASLARDDTRVAIVGADGTFSSPTVDGLAGKRVVVLVHGWAPGFADALEENPNLRAWDAHATWYTEVAAALHKQDPDVVVLGYDWLDGSATDTNLAPRSSRANTDIAGHVLGATLAELGAQAGSIEAIGHSHGSRVALHAVARMEEVGVQVASLTFLDSPETPSGAVGIVSGFSGGENALVGDLAAFSLRFGIGDGVTGTRVANVYSSIGEAYVVPGVTNVRLTAYGSVGAGHSYPVAWLASGGIVPLDGGTYVQDPHTGQVEPVGSAYIRSRMQALGATAQLASTATHHDVTAPATLYGLGGIGAPTSHQVLSLSSSGTSVWNALVGLPDGSFSLSIPYRYTTATDDAHLAAYINGELSSVALYAASTFAPRYTLDPFEDDGWRVPSVSTTDVSGLAAFSLGLVGQGHVEIGSIDVHSRELTLAVAPEPSRGLLVMVAFGTMLLCRRRTWV